MRKADLATRLAARPSGLRRLFQSQKWTKLIESLRLSSREKDILEALLAGADDEGAVADRLDISSHTVHTHLERLYRKLNVRSRTQLVVAVFLAFASHDTDHGDRDTGAATSSQRRRLSS